MRCAQASLKMGMPLGNFTAMKPTHPVPSMRAPKIAIVGVGLLGAAALIGGLLLLLF